MQILAIVLLAVAPGFAAPQCGEKPAATFLAAGQKVPAEKIELVGDGDACDDFGGQMIRTPKHGLKVYVNFNNECTIDLDAIDKLADEKLSPEALEFLKAQGTLVVVRPDWARLEGGDATLPMLGLDSLYVSGKAAGAGRFPEIVGDYFQLVSDVLAHAGHSEQKT